MEFHHHYFLCYFMILVSCNTGNLTVITDLPQSFKEVSAVEVSPNSYLIWLIEDAGNKNNLYAIDKTGKIIKDLDIRNASNIDWEDLTSDSLGNIYIGDFGNNSKKRKLFTIYKIPKPDELTSHTIAEVINYELPSEIKSKDFEAFFIFQNQFYIFSKENKGVLISVPAKEGTHTAKLITEFNLKGKNNKITSADISTDGKTIVLLNHDKLWQLSNFKDDQFFEGNIKSLAFKHNSQKEGICFRNNNSLYITDEHNKIIGGNLYLFNLK